MISKFLKANSFYHTCRYVCQKKGAQVLLAEGVRGHDFRLMAEDFQSQQQMRPGKGKAGAHLILSFHPDDKPSDELMQRMAQKYLDRMGLQNTQIAIVKHTDTHHPHLHILVNMVNNEGQAIPDSWIGLRGKKVAQELTQEHRLIPAVQKNLKATHLESLNEMEATKYEIYQTIAAALSHCRTLEELEFHLRVRGIEAKYKYKGRTGERQGISFKKGNLCFKGSEIDRNFSLGKLQKTLALQPTRQRKTKTGFIPKPQSGSGILTQPALKASANPEDQNPKSSISGPSSVTIKLIQELLRPVPNQGTSSYDPYEAERRRKKKRKRRGF